jgi:ethanolamine utilization protein EutQ (cupin superfamily)
MGGRSKGEGDMGKRLISEKDVQQAAKEGKKVLAVCPDECIVTPMAQDVAAALGITLETGAGGAAACPVKEASRVSLKTADSDMGALVEQVVARMQDLLPAGISAQRLGQVVREVVASRLATSPAPATAGGQAGARLIPGRQILAPPVTPVAVDGQVQLAQVLPGEAVGSLSAGILAWEKASFQRQVAQEEIDIVIEGELEISLDGGSTLRGRPGDMLYLPAGTRALYSTAASVKIACVNRL